MYTFPPIKASSISKTPFSDHEKTFSRRRRLVGSAVFLLEGCADGICAGGRIAGTDVDLFGGAGAGAVVVYAVGHVAGNAGVLVAGLTGLFRRIVVHGFKILSNSKITKELLSFVIYYDAIVFFLFIPKGRMFVQAYIFAPWIP